MTKEQAVELLEKLKNCRFHTAIIFYYSPISECVEERHIYADAYPEVLQWVNERCKEYLELNFDFAIYLDGGIQFCNGYIWKD